MKLRDLKLGYKQALGFGVILAIMAGVNIFAINKMAAIKAEIDEVTSNRLPAALAISDLSLNSAELRISQLQHAFTTIPARQQRQKEMMIALIDQINANIDTYVQLKTESEALSYYSPEQDSLYRAFDRKWELYQDLSFAFFELLDKRRMPEAVDLLNGEAQQVFDDFSADLAALVEANRRDAYAAARRADLTYSSTRAITRTLLIITVLVSAFIAAGLARLIAVPVRQLATAARSVAQGNLDVQLDRPGQDEIGNLSQSFNTMTRALREAREKMQGQADRLQQQQAELQATNRELEEKSSRLARQNAEIEHKNRELERTMHQLQKAQQQLVQSERMASLGQLTAGIAHEINNPINFVSSNIKPLRRDVGDLLTLLTAYEATVKANQLEDRFRGLEQLKQELEFPFLQQEIDSLLNGIQEGAQRTTEIVKGLRNFTRLDEDERKLADVNKCLESALLMLKHQLKNRVEVVKDFGKLPEIPCFPGKLNQAFMNLLSNASQAIVGTGTIYIKTAFDGEIVTVSIRDTGQGMSEEVKRRIFEPFFTTKDVGEGTGLGLAITYGIIEDHDGNIEVYSTPGEGSEFVVTLPARPSATAAAKPARQPQ